MGYLDAILFDLGDTLVNFGMGLAETKVVFKEGSLSTYSYLKTLGKPLPRIEDYYKAHYRAMNRAYLWSRICCRDFCYSEVLRRATLKLGIKLTLAERKELAWRWYQPIADKARLDAGVKEMLEKFSELGIKLAIVSNTLVPGYCLDRHLSALGLLRYFPVRVYSSQTGIRKPHRRIFEIALERLSVRPSDACFVGDVPSADIKGGHRAGMRTVFKPSIKSGWRTYSPDVTIQTITDLPKTLQKLGWCPAPLPEPLPEPATA